MAKLLLLLAVLSVGSDCNADSVETFTKITSFVNFASEAYSEITQTVREITHSTTEVPFANKQLEEMEGNTKGLSNNTRKAGASINNLGDEFDAVNENLDSVNEQVKDINEVAKVMLSRLNRVLSNLNQITMELMRIPIEVSEKMGQLLNKILKDQYVQDAMDNELKQLWEHTTRIDTWYKKFLTIVDPKFDFQKIYYDDFTNTTITDMNDGMQATIEYIFAMFTTGTRISSIHDNILDFVTTHQKRMTFSEKCDLQRSFQEQLRIIYNIVVTSELRVFMMTVFTYHRKQILEQADGGVIITDNYKNELYLVVQKSLNRMKGYLQAMKLATKDSSSEIFRCDQKNPVINDDVFRLDNLFGLYYLNVQQISSDCEVEDLDIINYRGYVDSLELTDSNAFIAIYHPRYQCNGLLHKCIPGGKRIFCEARLGSGKRYEWMSMENKRHSDCNGRYIDTIASAPCTDVICQCSEEGPKSTATRAFNLRPQFSDVANNKVVTNVRLYKKDNVVHIQVQHGTLQSEARVDEDSLQWVPLGKFVRTTDDEGEGFNWTDNKKLETLVEDQDYTYVTHDSAEFNLDDILVKTGYVVTGVKFERQKLNPKKGKNLSALRIKVHGTKFDYAKGKLILPTEDEEFDMNDERYFKWFNSSSFDVETDVNYGRGRNELVMEGRGDSLSAGNNEIDVRPNQFVRFQPTAFVKNFGQTTIPYFDSRPAIIKKGAALGGVGITHRGIEGYGGYIAPKVFTINHSEYIEFEVEVDEVAKQIVQKLRTETKTTEVSDDSDLNEEDVD